jgi:hypothetical protein
MLELRSQGNSGVVVKLNGRFKVAKPKFLPKVPGCGSFRAPEVLPPQQFDLLGRCCTSTCLVRTFNAAVPAGNPIRLSSPDMHEL